MTDKQIINEIDISKCEFCENNEYCYIYSGTASFRWFCEENEDCQIKNLLLQLQAKEQECKALREEKAYTDMACEQFEKQLKAKEQECEWLKKQCELEKEMCTSWCDESYKDKEENIKLKEEIDNLKQYKSSKQASYEVLQKKCNELELKNRKLKSEKEELKDKLKTKARGWANVNDQILEEVNQLKSEIEQLQKEREKAKNYNLEYGQLLIKATNKNNKLKTENEDLKKINKANAKSYEKHWYKLEKYKAILTEIKEICNIGIVNGLSDNEYLEFIYGTQKQILQKISEVLNEYNG